MEKDTNPKQIYGDTKVGLSSVPMGPLYALAVAMAEGGMKYGRHNYREMGCRHSTYLDAAMGHLVTWWEGEDIDEESGVHHLIKAAACIFVLYDSILMENDNDDRPPVYPKDVPLRINEVIAKLSEKYPNPKEPFTEVTSAPTMDEIPWPVYSEKPVGRPEGKTCLDCKYIRETTDGLHCENCLGTSGTPNHLNYEAKNEDE